MYELWREMDNVANKDVLSTKWTDEEVTLTNKFVLFKLIHLQRKQYTMIWLFTHTKFKKAF